MSKNDKFHHNQSKPADTTTTPIADEDLRLESDDLNSQSDDDQNQGEQTKVTDSNISEDEKIAAALKAQEEEAAAKLKAQEEEAAAKLKAQEEADAKAAEDAKKTGVKEPGIGLDDVINVTIKRTPGKNGTAMISVMDIIDLILEYPLCTVEVRECHVPTIYQHIKSIKRTKRFATISDKSRVLMVENWKRTYGLR